MIDTGPINTRRITGALLTCQCVLYVGDLVEVFGVWDLEQPHGVGVAPLLEVLLEGSATPVRVVSTDLTLVLDTTVGGNAEELGGIGRSWDEIGSQEGGSNFESSKVDRFWIRNLL